LAANQSFRQDAVPFRSGAAQPEGFPEKGKIAMHTYSQQQLDMRWVLVRGCLRLVWIGRQPQPCPISLPQAAVPQHEKQAA